MDCTNVKEDDAADEEGGKDDFFFIGDLSSSEDELASKFSHQEYNISCEQAARLSRKSSPPLLLAFSIPSKQTLKDGSLSSTSSEIQEEGDADQPVEDWMILGREEQQGDSSIQLNLSYWSSSEDDSGDEDHSVKSVTDIWAVSEKDKYDADLSLPVRYFMPGRSQTCNVCNRRGHLTRSCYYHKQKCPTCILCGIQGHIQRDCPSRLCPSCGLPSHGFQPCERPPLWNQHCQRCGMAGHLPDSCPDTWRQYHLTIQFEAPLRPRTDYKLKDKKCPHCYNCSQRGHYGYECTKRRMISGTFLSVPYVCHYDTMEDILQLHARMQERGKEPVIAGSLSEKQPFERTRESSMESQTIKERSRIKQETWGPAGRRKTWPERRRERREVKRLRKEAQARRESGLLERSRGNFDDEDSTAEPFISPLQGHRESTSLIQKRRRAEEGGRKCRKSKEAERWKKRRGIKHRDLYPHGDIDICTENLVSPKQRVRHRRR